MSKSTTRWAEAERHGHGHDTEGHPALHPQPGYHLRPEDAVADAHSKAFDNDRHFAPLGWEDVNVGACPCGELVRWDQATESWLPDRTLRMLILDEKDAETVSGRFRLVRFGGTVDSERLGEAVRHQLILNEEQS